MNNLIKCKFINFMFTIKWKGNIRNSEDIRSFLEFKMCFCGLPSAQFSELALQFLLEKVLQSESTIEGKMSVMISCNEFIILVMICVLFCAKLWWWIYLFNNFFYWNFNFIRNLLFDDFFNDLFNRNMHDFFNWIRLLLDNCLDVIMVVVVMMVLR